MRTRAEIIQEIDDEAGQYTELNELQGNTSNVAFCGQVKNVIAFAILTLEILFKQHLNDVDKLIKTTEPGTDDWYKEVALQYQDGDTIIVQNNLTVYPTQDENKRIVKRVSIQEKTSGGILMKVAKQETDQSLSPLYTDEKTRFEIYISRVKFAGMPIEVRSQDADILRLEMTVELDALLYDNTGKLLSDNSTPITTAIDKYLREYPFDTAFYLSKLINEIQELAGIKDVDITASEMNGVAFARKITEIPSGHLKLDTNSMISYVLT